jgi:hypothetical protein
MYTLNAEVSFPVDSEHVSAVAEKVRTTLEQLAHEHSDYTPTSTNVVIRLSQEY